MDREVFIWAKQEAATVAGKLVREFECRFEVPLEFLRKVQCTSFESKVIQRSKVLGPATTTMYGVFQKC